MIFELGKYYEHASGKKISIIGEAISELYGKSLIAEQCCSPDFIPVGYGSCHAENWDEIPKEEWDKCFSYE